MASKRIPLILCGKTEQMGTGVIEALKPEYEVIQFLYTLPTASAIIPALLSGNPPPTGLSDLSSLGTHNYADRPKAIILGGGWETAQVDILRKAVADARASSSGDGSSVRKVPWLRVDTSIPAPSPPGPEYLKVVVERTKRCLDKLKGEGKFEGEGGDDSVYFF